VSTSVSVLVTWQSLLVLRQPCLVTLYGLDFSLVGDLLVLAPLLSLLALRSRSAALYSPLHL
jgi:hypothetical protein